MIFRKKLCICQSRETVQNSVRIISVTFINFLGAGNAIKGIREFVHRVGRLLIEIIIII